MPCSSLFYAKFLDTTICNLGTKVLLLDLNILHHFLIHNYEALRKILVMLLLKRQDVEMDKEEEAMDEAESGVEVVKVTPSTVIS